MTFTPHHLGICVTDVERSVRFWCEGLGFSEVAVLDVGSEWSDALEIGGPIAFTARFITKGGYTFEILDFQQPRPHGSPSTRRDQVGLTHFTVDVPDIDAAIDHLAACGGTLIESTRTKVDHGSTSTEIVFVSDPDGVRVELSCHRPRREVL
jgi:catechol 2,3-dioxygenase-like lactoylglutathione lyase family enzyme